MVNDKQHEYNFNCIDINAMYLKIKHSLIVQNGTKDWAYVNHKYNIC